MKIITFFLIISAFWVLFVCWWMIYTWIKNVRYSLPIHRIVSFFLFFKSLNCLFTVFDLASCQEREACYWDLAVNSTSTIYSTFMFTQLLLISIGFNIFKEYLSRNELTFIAFIMGCIYLGFSCFSIKKPQFIFVLFLVICISFSSLVKFTNNNLKKLARKRNEFSAQGNAAMKQITEEKIGFYKVFLKLACGLFIGKILVINIKWFQIKQDPTQFGFSYVDVADYFIEFLGMAPIIFLIRPQQRINFYNIFVEQIEREMRPLIHILQAKVPVGFSVDTREKQPFLVLTPRGKESCRHENFLIANPFMRTEK